MPTKSGRREKRRGSPKSRGGISRLTMPVKTFLGLRGKKPAARIIDTQGTREFTERRQGKVDRRGGLPLQEPPAEVLPHMDRSAGSLFDVNPQVAAERNAHQALRKKKTAGGIVRSPKDLEVKISGNRRSTDRGGDARTWPGDRRASSKGSRRKENLSEEDYRKLANRDRRGKGQ